MPDPVRFAVGEDESLPALVTRLVGETRLLVKAEVGVYKARVGDAFAVYKAAAILFAVAGVLALTGLIALLVGAILSLATLVGPGWATLIVALATFAIAGILALVGKAKLRPTAPESGA